VSARRDGAAGTSGDYICDVAFDEGSTSKFDLLGHTGVDNAGKSARWYVGVTDLGTHTSVDVGWTVDDEV